MQMHWLTYWLTEWPMLKKSLIDLGLLSNNWLIGVERSNHDVIL